MSQPQITLSNPPACRILFNDSECEINSYQSLWRKLLIESFYDACSSSIKKVSSAMEWISGRQFEVVLQLAGMSVKPAIAREHFLSAVQQERVRLGYQPINLEAAA